MNDHTPWLDSGIGIDLPDGRSLLGVVLANDVDLRTFIIKAVNCHDALVKALETLLRFCDDATLYEKENPNQYSPYIDAREALAKTRA